MQDFPGNSHVSKVAAEKERPAVSETSSEPKKVTKVINGRATQRKKSLGGRFKEMFFASVGEESFAEHLVEKIVVPRAKEMLLTIANQTIDGIRQAVEERIFGTSTPSNTRGTSYTTGRPVVNYNRMSSGAPAGQRDRARSGPPPVIRRSNVIQDIILESREDGDTVLENLDAMIDSIGHCTVGDLYGLVDIPTNRIDESWGWTDLSRARVNVIPGTNPPEYLVTMPPPRPIEN